MTNTDFADLGKNCVIKSSVILGLRYKNDCKRTIIGDSAVIREYTVIYADCIIGNDFKTGHFVTIRENTKIGDRVLVGSGTVIEGYVTIESRVKMEANVYISQQTKIGSDVFIGPNVVMTNDKYPQKMRDEYEPVGPCIEDNVSIGAHSTILPGVKIGTGSFIAAGALVTKNVPPLSLVKGVPGIVYPLPEKLREKNKAKRW